MGCSAPAAAEPALVLDATGWLMPVADDSGVAESEAAAASNASATAAEVYVEVPGDSAMTSVDSATTAVFSTAAAAASAAASSMDGAAGPVGCDLRLGRVLFDHAVHHRCMVRCILADRRA